MVGIGVLPATDWLADSGLTIDNGVVCDDRLFAADGDRGGRGHRALALAARRRGGADPDRALAGRGGGGVAAARSLMAGRADAPPFTPVPYFWSDQYGIRLQVLGTPRGSDEIHIADGTPEEGKFVALFGRADRLRAVMAISRPRQLMGFRPLLEQGSSWDERCLAHDGGLARSAPTPRSRAGGRSPFRRRCPKAPESCPRPCDGRPASGHERPPRSGVVDLRARPLLRGEKVRPARPSWQ